MLRVFPRSSSFRPRASRSGSWRAALIVLATLGAASCSEPPTVERPAEGLREPGPPHLLLLVADAVRVTPGGAVEQLAAEGVTVGPVRTVSGTPALEHAALITGIRPERLGWMPVSDPSRPAGLGRIPPPDVRAFPERLRRARYYTVRSGPAPDPLVVRRPDGKVPADDDEPRSDHGLLGVWDDSGPGLDWTVEPGDPCAVAFGCGSYDGRHGGPVYVQVHLTGSPDEVDREVGRLLGRLDEDGLRDQTLVMVLGLDGESPLVARWPGRTAPGTVEDGPVTTLDVAPTLLAAAGISLPAILEGRVAVGPATAPPRELTGATEPLLGEPWPGDEPPVAAAPEGYPRGGLFHVAPRVELSCETEGAAIVYTTEREAPFRWRLYTGPFRMRFWTLRVQCGRLGYADSPVVSYDFDIE